MRYIKFCLKLGKLMLKATYMDMMQRTVPESFTGIAISKNKKHPLKVMFIFPLTKMLETVEKVCNVEKADKKLTIKELCDGGHFCWVISNHFY